MSACTKNIQLLRGLLTVLGSFAVDANVEARNTQVGDRSRERRLNLERTAVGVDGLLGVATVRERGTEAVPQKVILTVS